jgi:hypothetical protein
MTAVDQTIPGVSQEWPDKCLKCHLAEYQYVFDDENCQNEGNLGILAQYPLDEVGGGTMWHCVSLLVNRSFWYPLVVSNRNNRERRCLSANRIGTEATMPSSEKSFLSVH